MPSITRGLRRASDLSISQRRFLLVLVSIGSSILYTPAYLKNVFYDPLKEAIGTSNAGVGELLGYYAITATVCYFPSGVVADKVRVRTLAWVGFTTTAMLTYLYAMLPSFAVLRLVFIGMGVTTILIWWGIRFKLVRLISEEDAYSRNIGISYGLYGAAGLVVGFISMKIIEWFEDSAAVGIQSLLIFLGTLILILGILSFFFIPKFEGEIDPTKKSFDIRQIREALRNPVVWISAACLFCVYFFYTGVNYTTPYLKNVLLASASVTSFVSIVRTYGITLASGPAFGFLAKATGSPSKVIFGGSIVCAAGLFVFTILPPEPGMVLLVAGVTIVLGFIANGVFGIVSSQLTEGKVPIPIFGTAAGILSVIGFLPDTFSSTWFGKMIDDQPKDAYAEIFLILAGFAVAAGVFALILLWYVRSTGKAERPDLPTAPEEVDSAPSEPTPAPSYEEAAESAAAAKSAFDSKKGSGNGSAWSSHAE